MQGGINTDLSILSRQLSAWSDWAYTLSLTKKRNFKNNIEKLNLGDRVTFVREPDNEKDPNAIIVRADVGDVGYLAGGTAEILAPLLDNEMVDYYAKVAEVVPYSKLENKRKNPIVRLYIEIKDRVDVEEKTVDEGDNARQITIDLTGKGNSNFDILRGLLGDFFGGESQSMTLEERIEAANDGDDEAMYMLAEEYLRGSDEVEPDSEKAAYWMEKAAEEENPTAQFNIGLFYAKGHGVPRDFDKAIKWEERAAENGDEDAPRLIRNWKRITELMPLAESGDAQAQAELAGSFMSLGGSLDQAGPGDEYDVAVKWARAAVDQGNLDGMYTLALAYNHGRGVERDMTKAIELYRKAAEAGHAPSQWNLGACYMRGDGVKLNQEIFKKWAEKSAAQGYALAVRGLAHAYKVGEISGDGYEKKILELYEKACTENPDNSELQHELALMYMDEDENGYMISLDRALYWFKKAADNGDEMCASQYRMWSYVKKLIGEKVLPEDTPEGEYLFYIFENGLEEEAENYMP